MAATAAAAARLEASDDVLLVIFARLSVEERLRFACVSRRWQRLVQAELCFPRYLLWRATAIVRRAGHALRMLDVSSGRGEDGQKLLDKILPALVDGAGAELRTLVAWVAQGDSEPTDPLNGLPLLSSKEALRLLASCPHLDVSTRLSVRAEGAAQAVALLDALPGRHAVFLSPPAEPPGASGAPFPPADDAEQAALRALLRHPRLCALGVSVPAWDESEPWRADSWFDAHALPAIVDALGPQGQRDGCSLEHLRVEEYPSDEMARTPAFPDAAAVAAAFSAARPPMPECSLRSFAVIHQTLPSFVRGVLAASAGSLTALNANFSISLVDTDSVDGAATLAAVLRHVGPSLQALQMTMCDGEGQPDSAPLCGLAPLLASPGCRLRSLRLCDVDLTQLALADAWQPAGDDFSEEPEGGSTTALQCLVEALADNRSLRALHLPRVKFLESQIAALATALASRAVPLDSVTLGESDNFVSTAGAGSDTWWHRGYSVQLHQHALALFCQAGARPFMSALSSPCVT